MQTIENTIHKLRKLSHEFESTHNSTEMHSNTSFFDEERSQDFQDCDSSIGEEFSDSWEMSSICTENSIHHHRSTFNGQLQPPQQFKPNPTSNAVRGTFADEEIGDVDKDVNNSSQSGKGIAIHVRGQGSTGLLNKKEKKTNKLIEKKQSLIENNQDNNWPQPQPQQQPQPQSHSSYSSPSYSSPSQQKQVSQSSKIMLAYLMMEKEVERSADMRASNFLEKYMPVHSEQIKKMVKETYKLILIPEQILQQLAAVLSSHQKTLHLNLCLRRLNLSQNKHPLAAKAADKLKKHFGDCC